VLARAATVEVGAARSRGPPRPRAVTGRRRASPDDAHVPVALFRSSARTPFAASNCPAALPPARISRPNSGGKATTNAAHVPVATDPFDYDNGDEVGHRRRAHRRRSAARCRPASGHCGPAVDGDIAVGRDRTAHADAAKATSGTVAAACACAAATASSRVTACAASCACAAVAAACCVAAVAAACGITAVATIAGV
jgi:hypothetical protein